MGTKYLEGKTDSSRQITKWIYILHGVGLAGMLIPYTRPFFLMITPIHLLLCLALIQLDHRSYWSRGWWIIIGIIFIGGYLVEFAGVHTGLLFGEYDYGPTLGPHLFDIPPVMGINWVLLVIGSAAFARLFTADRFLIILLASVSMVLLDLVIEPVAPGLDFWHWEIGYAPLRNYVAWFGCALLFQSLYSLLQVKVIYPSGLVFFLLQFLFFGTLLFVV